eukprot:TRINITY_DN7521_c0_g1_i1.p1 TRINITY_DN7521_c0_g1~~TRINITY_DN7521_c0_g1_i1.p1  ORF type:complete len:2145 (+),score=488.76 TRINITY_DN7521_c0_g1_i1:43-6477(+)
MSERMRAFWGVTPHPKRSRPGGREVDEDQVQSLIEICGSELSRKGARKLLQDNRGDTMTACNVYMDMSDAQRTRLNNTPGSDDEENTTEIGTMSTTLPEGWTEFKKEIWGWIKGQCQSLGCEVRLLSAEPTTLLPVLSIKKEPRSYAGLSAMLQASSRPPTSRATACISHIVASNNIGVLDLPRVFSKDERCGLQKTIPVHFRRGLIDTLLRREKKADERLKSLESKLIPLKDMKGNIYWSAEKWRRGPGSSKDKSEEAGKGVVEVSSCLSSDVYSIPCSMLSFTKRSEQCGAGIRVAAGEGSAKDPLVSIALETACSKVVLFDRVGSAVSSEWLSAICETLQNRFTDTEIFYKKTPDGYRFAVCGLGCHWVRYWLLGRLLWEIPEGHAGFRGDTAHEIQKKTACSVLLSPSASLTPEGDTQKGAPLWEWNQSEEWKPFGPKETILLESAFNSGNDIVNLTLAGRSYVCNLSDMQQTNVATGTSRAIRRSGGGPPNSGDDSSNFAKALSVWSRATFARILGSSGDDGLQADFGGMLLRQDDEDDEEEEEEEEEEPQAEVEDQANEEIDEDNEDELRAAIALSQNAENPSGEEDQDGERAHTESPSPPLNDAINSAFGEAEAVAAAAGFDISALQQLPPEAAADPDLAMALMMSMAEANSMNEAATEAAEDAAPESQQPETSPPEESQTEEAATEEPKEADESASGEVPEEPKVEPEVPREPESASPAEHVDPTATPTANEEVVEAEDGPSPIPPPTDAPNESDEEDAELAAALAMSLAESPPPAPATDAANAEDEVPIAEAAEEVPATEEVVEEVVAAEEEPEPEQPASTEADETKQEPEEGEDGTLKNSASPFDEVLQSDNSNIISPIRCTEGNMWIAVVGPQNTRSRAVGLVEKEREVREEILRILPSMQGIVHLHKDEVQDRIGCKLVSLEGQGMVRVVGQPAELEKARAALLRLVPMWQTSMQAKRLKEVTQELVCEVSKIEVRVPISDRMRQLLSQPIGMHASGFVKKFTGSLYDKYRIGRKGDKRGEAPDDAGKVQVMWVTLDEFAMDVTKKMTANGVPVPKEWTAMGAVMGVYVGDRIRNNGPFNVTPATRKSVEGFNVPSAEEGVVVKLESWLNQDPQLQRAGLEVFLKTVDEWMKCTCEQRITDPGRPSLVAAEVDWTVKSSRDSKGHFGMWRQDGLTVNYYWCSNQNHRDWPYCEHNGNISVPHWSCCGERSFNTRCTKPRSAPVIQVGCKVRVKASVKEPKFRWGHVKPGDIGTVTKIKNDKCSVEFPKVKKWAAYIPDLEIAPDGNIQKGTLHNPALGFISRLGTPISYDKVSSVADLQRLVARAAMLLVQQKWYVLADEYLLSELSKVLSFSSTSEVSDLRTAHATTQRARHRLKEMEKDAEKTSSKLIDSIYVLLRAAKRLSDQEDTSKIIELLNMFLQSAQECLREWTQDINAADFDIERQLLKLRQALSVKDKDARLRRSVWDIIQHISEVSGAFIDYRPPNLHLRVSGNEVNIRAAMQHLRYLGDEGARGLEKSVTVSIQEDVAARLKKNSCVLLQLIEQQAGLHDIKLLQDPASGAETLLEVVGTEEQVAKALNFLDIRDDIKSDEYATAIPSHSDWGRQQSTIPASDPKICCACLSPDEEVMYELLCGHSVHPSCLQKWVQSCIERSLGINDSGEMEGPGAIAVCPMTGGGGCTHILTTREFCEAARKPDGGAHATLDNLEKHMQKRLPTHDRIRSCPRCSEWVVVGSKTEPVLCKACGHTFCAVRGMSRCGGTAHYFSSCDQFARAKVETLKRRGQDVPAEVEAVGQMPENCVPCRRCQSWIMREEDLGQRCRYMVCRECMYEFCWLCLLPAVNHKHVHSSDATDKSKPPECDPDNRDERRDQLLERMQEGEVVNVWNDCSSCSRCHKWPIVSTEKAFACLQCPNVYLCEECEKQGCTDDPDHVLDAIPRIESSRGKQVVVEDMDELEVDEAFWNKVLPREREWECMECGSKSVAETCGNCGSPRAQLKNDGSVTCGSGHEMLVSDFKEGAYKSGWVCNKCGSSNSGPRWFCRPCRADFCFTCVPEETSANNKCINGHTLCDNSSSKNNSCCAGPGCVVTFPKSAQRWSCHECSYDLCLACYKGKSSPLPKNYILNLLGVRSAR